MRRSLPGVAVARSRGPAANDPRKGSGSERPWRSNLKDEDISLDPRDWEEFARIGHRMIDDVLAYVRDARKRPVWQSMPEDVRERLRAPLPLDGSSATGIYEQFREDVLPYAHGNNHPRFWGWVNGSGTVLGAYADLLTSILNGNAAGFDHVSVALEEQVLSWQKEMLGYPAAASGLLVSGGSAANLIGLAVARDRYAPNDVRYQGVDRSAPLRLYCSAETHSSVTKAASLLGIGSENVRRIRVDRDFRIDTAALREAILDDRCRGFHPFCIVGNAGTVNTGATDDLQELADIAALESIWLHVDGAFGAVTRLSPKLRGITAGMERADSIAFDLHKWLHVPIDAGCILVRDAEAHRKAFQYVPEYLMQVTGGIAAIPSIFSDLGFELSRRGRGLKVWMAFREHGIRGFARAIEANVRQAAHLARLVQASDDLELLAPVPLNVVCFRYRGGGEGELLDEFNEAILVALQERGIAAPSSTRIEGRFAIRVAITNHRTVMSDMDALVEAVRSIAREARMSAPLAR